MANNVLPIPLPVLNGQDKTAFGELAVAQPTPVVQMAANYGIGDKSFVFTTDGGTVIAEDSLFKAKTSTLAGSFASILSKKQLIYRPGQGALTRFTTLFSAGVAGNRQIGGLITATDSLAFGYNGTEFGVFHSHSGRIDLQTLTITTPAGGSENATVTVNGIAYIVPITAGTVEHNAYEIAEELNIQVPLCDFTSNGATVVSAPVLAGPAIGIYAFTSASAVGAWVEDVAGLTTVDEFIPQSSWNRNVFPDLDPTKGNVYQIRFQYLGFGGISFYIENPTTTEFELAHVIEYANDHFITSVTNPSFRVGWATTNVTNTTEVEVSGASIGAFVEGQIVRTEDPRSLEASVLSVGTVAQINMLTIRNRLAFGGQRNRAPILAIKVTGLTESTKGAILRVVKNATITGDLDYQYLDDDFSVTEYALDNGIVLGGIVVSSVSVSAAGNEINLSPLDVDILPGETLTIAMRTVSGSASDSSVTVSFREDL